MNKAPEPASPNGNGGRWEIGNLIASIIPSPPNWRGIIRAVKSPFGVGALAILAVLAFAALLIVSGILDPSAWLILAPVFLAVFLLLVYLVVKRPPPLPNSSLISNDGSPVDLPEGFPAAESLDKSVDIISSLPTIEVVTWVDQEDDRPVERTSIKRISPVAKEFFGFNMIHPTQEVIDLGVANLFGRLASWSKPPRPYWSDLVSDQDRVKKEIVQKGRAFARVPIKFNGTHEYFPLKTFVPIITEFNKVVGNGVEKTLLRVLYLDIDTLPKTLFTGAVWNKMVEGFDLSNLAVDFEHIRDRFSGERFEEDEQEDRRERECRMRALNCAIARLRNGNDPHTLDDLSKVGWYRLRSVAASMAERPEYAVQFIDRILGRTEPPVN